MKHPSAVTACNLDLENLITDSNRSIATLAITTLLKTGSESSVDRLMKQISSFVSEISDEFKVCRWRPLLLPAAPFAPILGFFGGFFKWSFSCLLILRWFRLAGQRCFSASISCVLQSHHSQEMKNIIWWIPASCATSCKSSFWLSL